MNRLTPRVAAVATCGVVGIAVLFGAEALGCPNCKDAVNTSDPEGLNLARGYFYSILLMLAMPFTLVGSFGCYVWREMRRQQAREADHVAGRGNGLPPHDAASSDLREPQPAARSHGWSVVGEGAVHGQPEP